MEKTIKGKKKYRDDKKLHLITIDQDSLPMWTRITYLLPPEDKKAYYNCNKYSKWETHPHYFH